MGAPAPTLLYSASSPPGHEAMARSRHANGNPAYIVAVFVVFGCLLSLVVVALRHSVCKGRVRGQEVQGNARPSVFSFRGMLFGTAAMSPGALPVTTYRPTIVVDTPGSTPHRGLLNDLPCSPGLDPGVVKRLPMVCYKAVSSNKHRRQGSGLRESSGRAGGGDGARIDSGRGMMQDGSEACSVCLSSFKEGDFLRVLPDCSHMFHVDCVDTWLISRSSCPLCRSEITGKTPSCSSKLGKLLARLGSGRSFRCSRSFSGQDLGSFRSRLGSDHGSFRSRLGTDQEAGVLGSNRFYEVDLGNSAAADQRVATVIQIEEPSLLHSTKAIDADSGKPASAADRTTDIDMPNVQPPSPSGPRSILLLPSEDSAGGDVTARAVFQFPGSSQPISPGRLLVPKADER